MDGPALTIGTQPTQPISTFCSRRRKNNCSLCASTPAATQQMRGPASPSRLVNLRRRRSFACHSFEKASTAIPTPFTLFNSCFSDQFKYCKRFQGSLSAFSACRRHFGQLSFRICPWIDDAPRTKPLDPRAQINDPRSDYQQVACTGAASPT